MTNYKKSRCPHHDYRSRCTYLITLTKEPGVEPFSFLFGTKVKAYKDAGVKYSPLGRLIKDNIRAIPERFPDLRINRYVVMPDHVHFIIEILVANKYHLGDIISRLTRDCNVATPKYHQIFEHGYHDRILRRKGQLNNMRNYIIDNPRRRLIMENLPSYLKEPMVLKLFGKDYVIFGNFFLLKDPDKVQVRMSSKYSESELNACLALYEETIRGAGVLVSPFIHDMEKHYRDKAIADGANLIYITRNPIPERFKPPKMLYDLWSEGRLLLISTYHSDQPEKLTRQESLSKNSLAAQIASSDFGELLLHPLYK